MKYHLSKRGEQNLNKLMAGRGKGAMRAEALDFAIRCALALDWLEKTHPEAARGFLERVVELYDE